MIMKCLLYVQVKPNLMQGTNKKLRIWGFDIKRLKFVNYDFQLTHWHIQHIEDIDISDIEVQL